MKSLRQGLGRQPHRPPHHREAHFKNRQGAKRDLTELSAKLQTNPLTRSSFQRNGSGDFYHCVSSIVIASSG